jgi:ribosomal protein S18 acetylase RimI-like enzyme
MIARAGQKVTLRARVLLLSWDQVFAVDQSRVVLSVSLQPVRRLENEADVELERAVALAALAVPSITDPERFFDHLRSMASQSRLFAAVDGRDTVRATCGYVLAGTYATVIFVNTDPAWRRRGIGLAMTAHAIAHAQASGATVVTLDASDEGRTIYDKLGFEVVDQVTRFRLETA